MMFGLPTKCRAARERQIDEIRGFHERAQCKPMKYAHRISQILVLGLMVREMTFDARRGPSSFCTFEHTTCIPDIITMFASRPSKQGQAP